MVRQIKDYKEDEEIISIEGIDNLLGDLIIEDVSSMKEEKKVEKNNKKNLNSLLLFEQKKEKDEKEN